MEMFMSANQSSIDPRLREVFAKVISADVARALKPDDSSDTIERWDSLSFVDIVLGLEQAFGVRFSTLEAARMSSVRGIQEILRDKGVLPGK
jgi:acyl carrier protein